MSGLLPSRTRTDPPAPEQTQTQPNHLSRRLHANSFRAKPTRTSGSHHHLHRPNVKDTVQSTGELKPPISFDHLLRRDKKGAESVRSGLGNSPDLDDGSSARHFEPVERQVRPEDIAQAKKDNARREEDLRASLKDVEEVGMSSTRQLDETYYTILEKAAILRSTVSSLQQLVEQSKRMHSSFRDHTSQLEQETKANLESFGNFDQQERAINDLVKKLQDSKGKTDQISDRLEAARLRVSDFEKRDVQKQAKRTARWRMTWAMAIGVLVFFIAILIARNRRQVGLQLDIVGQHLANIGDVVDDIASPLKAKLKASQSEDPYLRKLFDEL